MGINRSFYDGFADSWSTSRVSIHKGIIRAFEEMGAAGHLLDVGCGDGRVGRWAFQNIDSNGLKSYLGADFSAGLLAQTESSEKEFSFVCADMTSPEWSLGISRRRAQYDNILCFSALHHIPGPRRRLKIIREIFSLLRPSGRCIISVWQLSHVPRLQKKIVPWSKAGINATELDTNDLLVDWKMGGAGLRYVHEFQQSELQALCLRAGFEIQCVYRSDGQTGDMGLYIVLKKGPSAPKRP